MMRVLSWLLSGLFVLAAIPAKADIFTLNLDHCTGGCGVPIGTVEVTQDGADTVKIDVESTGQGFGFVSTGAGGGDQFFFNILGNPTISVSNVPAGWKLVSTTAGSLAGDGYSGNFEYAMTCDFGANPCGPGGSNPKAPPLIFDVTASGLTPASFIDSNGTSDGAIFAVDAISNETGNTGLVGAFGSGDGGGDGGGGSVPEPSSIVMLGTVLLIAWVGLRRKLAQMA